MKILYTILSALFGEVFNVLVKLLSRQDEVVPEVVPVLDELAPDVEVDVDAGVVHVLDDDPAVRFAGLLD